jgi:hypothetical protein
VGAILKKAMEDKERKGTAKPLMFVVLDELNKYAPKTGWSPIREVILDIAERGRSLGVYISSTVRILGSTTLSNLQRYRLRQPTNLSARFFARRQLWGQVTKVTAFEAAQPYTHIGYNEHEWPTSCASEHVERVRQNAAVMCRRS